MMDPGTANGIGKVLKGAGQSGDPNNFGYTKKFIGHYFNKCALGLTVATLVGAVVSYGVDFFFTAIKRPGRDNNNRRGDNRQHQ